MEYTRTLTDDEVKLLSHDLTDIKAWIDGAIDGKINCCKKRAAIEYKEMMAREGALTVPASDLVAALSLLNMEDYKSRLQRETVDVNLIKND